jgi:hypothetical protein
LNLIKEKKQAVNIVFMNMSIHISERSMDNLCKIKKLFK